MVIVCEVSCLSRVFEVKEVVIAVEAGLTL